MCSTPSDRPIQRRLTISSPAIWTSSGIPAPRCAITSALPPLEVVRRRGLPAAAGRRPHAARRHLQLVVQVAGPRPPAPARGPASSSSTASSTSSSPGFTHAPLVRLCERLLALANGLPAAAGARPRRPAAGPGTSAGCSWRTTDPPPWRSPSRWRCRRRPSAGSRRAPASPPSPTATTARPSGALSVGDLGLYGDPYRALTFPVHEAGPPALPRRARAIRAGWIPSRSGRASRPRWSRWRHRWRPSSTSRSCRRAGGMRLYSPALLARLAAWARAHGVYLIADEIAAGMGRLGAHAGQPPGARGAGRRRCPTSRCCPRG